MESNFHFPLICDKLLRHSLYGGFTLDAISATAFGLDVDCINNPDGSFIKNIKGIFQKGMGNWRRICITLASNKSNFYMTANLIKLISNSRVSFPYNTSIPGH